MIFFGGLLFFRLLITFFYDHMHGLAMDPVYVLIRKRAREIISRHPTPDFYKKCRWANTLSVKKFESDPVVIKLHAFVAKQLDDDFGHGLEHAIKVSQDAGALMRIEAETAGYPKEKVNRLIRIVHSAGLLHDAKRKQKDHAKKGALFAEDTIQDYPFSPAEQKDICRAIRHHEAFKKRDPIPNLDGALVSDCLYDGDKFRWGPDNFAHTVWDMVTYHNTPLSKFISYFPQGMDGISRIKKTFRTSTGKQYGPQIIDIGISIGEELYQVINTEFC